MFLEHSIAVVVPAKNEESQIADVLESMPEMVDAIFVVDDGSTDDMTDLVRAIAQEDERIKLLRHERSRGVGAAIATGYEKALDEGYDIAVVMAGDGQMDSADLELVVSPVALGFADYSKGNRFRYAKGLERIPIVRKLGNFVLSVLTKIVSGYWHVSDTQCGFTAVNRIALQQMDLEAIYPTYGCPNDILVKLNIAEMRVVEVPVNPLYGVGEQSKMQVPRVVIPISWMMIRKFCQRMIKKYVILSGHPVVFAYLIAFLCLSCTGLLGIYLMVKFIKTGLIMKVALISAGVSLILGVQLLLTAFWMDSDANRHLCIRLRPDQIATACCKEKSSTKGESALK
jgi:glycosyltransferase involved in cell wall biosynthesis